VIPIGKQTLRPSHIFYTPCSGIWQSVWVESAPANYITQLDVDADMNGQGKQFYSDIKLFTDTTYSVNMTVHSSSGTSTSVSVTIYESNSEKAIATYNGTSDSPFQFTVSSPCLWSPDSPTLYNMTISLGSDTVRSYTGFRTISKGTNNGVVRPLLNGEPIFMFGTLDQGFWPDGIYTPPNREAMVYDLEVLKSLGFNMLRKHVSHLSLLHTSDEMRIGY
jgi:beta-galactosidase/beta-glucuronidase